MFISGSIDHETMAFVAKSKTGNIIYHNHSLLELNR